MTKIESMISICFKGGLINVGSLSQKNVKVKTLLTMVLMFLLSSPPLKTWRVGSML